MAEVYKLQAGCIAFLKVVMVIVVCSRLLVKRHNTSFDETQQFCFSDTRTDVAVCVCRMVRHSA